MDGIERMVLIQRCLHILQAISVQRRMFLGRLRQMILLNPHRQRAVADGIKQHILFQQYFHENLPVALRQLLTGFDGIVQCVADKDGKVNHIDFDRRQIIDRKLNVDFAVFGHKRLLVQQGIQRGVMRVDQQNAVCLCRAQAIHVFLYHAGIHGFLCQHTGQGIQMCLEIMGQLALLGIGRTQCFDTLLLGLCLCL